MTALAFRSSPGIAWPLRPRARRALGQHRTQDGPTLDDVIVGAWEDLSAHDSAACPVCGGTLAPLGAAGSDSMGGGCRDCASHLS